VWKSISKRLPCNFAGNDQQRLNEDNEVMAMFAAHLGVHVICVDAEERFLSALKGIEDPDQKRKVVGRVFIEVFDAEAHKIEGVKWLAQGTIYPDVIESAGASTGKAHVIKSRHNVGGLPAEMNLTNRAPEGTLQGRSAQTRHATRPAP